MRWIRKMKWIFVHPYSNERRVLKYFVTIIRGTYVRAMWGHIIGTTNIHTIKVDQEDKGDLCPPLFK
jgi:hypothetical protein